MNQEIAIIAMSGRFPGAANIDEFWQNIQQGIETVTFFSNEELLAAGVEPALLEDPRYVKARALLTDIEAFDASFFGYSPKDAAILDPQHRLLLEEAWQAFESAGYDPETFQGRIGVYAGSSTSQYLSVHLYANRELLRTVDPLQLTLSNDKDHLAPRVSYKLNLTGPSVSVQTACSTSLVAVHLACQSLLNGECDMVLAGGVAVRVPQTAGYRSLEGGITSPDGHCRAFDAQAQGTISGNGVGVVILKRLGDALADGDPIHALIKGSAVNNDGAQKAGYTAPGVNGQVAVISEALAMARVHAGSVTYVEAHGTGTPVGDPIEIAALTQAYRVDTSAQGFCALGSVKTNIGHLDAAAGIAGLIKSVMALKHRLLPPSLHFVQPNPLIDFASSPFYINTSLAPWETAGQPRIAGVSSFGMGGTNAHVILQEAPARGATGPSRDWHLLVLSAKTPTALHTMTLHWRDHLKRHPELSMADVAYTSQVGRKAFKYRRTLLCRDLADAVALLETPEAHQVFSHALEHDSPPVAFLFPGQGSQYVGMTAELYRAEPIFREQVDRCSTLLHPWIGCDLRQLLYPATSSSGQQAEERLQQTAIAQPALFTVEYALARLWMAWGVQPRALIGHSLGEYVAACIANVFTLEDALALVATRGRLMQALPAGAMLSVQLPEHALRAQLDPHLSLAAVNGPTHCVVSGPPTEIARLQDRLTRQGVASHRLSTSHAFHSPAMDPILAPFAAEVARVAPASPTIPSLSNTTGTWISAQETTDPGYWARQLRQPVLFAQGVQLLLQEQAGLLLEVGPGRTLSTLVKRQMEASRRHQVLTSLDHPSARRQESACMVQTLGQLWLYGVRIDWPAYYAHEQRQRLPLPTYPFERQRCWIDPHRVSAFPQAENRERPAGAPPQVPQDHSPQRAFSAPTGEVEENLAILWQEILGMERADTHENFFASGGDSLTAALLISRVRDTFLVDLPLRSIFEKPTIADLAQVLEETIWKQLEALSLEELQQLTRDE